MSIILDKNHIMLTSKEEMFAICEPIRRYFGVTFFSYVIHYPNAHRVQLCMSSTNWVEYYYRHFSRYVSKDGNLGYQNLYTSIIPWEAIASRKTMNIEMRQHFNLANGIAILKKHEDYIECCHFSAAADDAKSQRLISSHIDLLEKFIDYFKERAAHLIAEAKKQSINMQYPCLIQRTNNEVLLLKDKNAFLKEITITSKTKSLAHSKLTLRETECVNLYMKGKKAKEIAAILKLSCRTVENYLQNARGKLGVASKFDLIVHSIE